MNIATKETLKIQLVVEELKSAIPLVPENSNLAEQEKQSIRFSDSAKFVYPGVRRKWPGSAPLL